MKKAYFNDFYSKGYDRLSWDQWMSLCFPETAPLTSFQSQTTTSTTTTHTEPSTRVSQHIQPMSPQLLSDTEEKCVNILLQLRSTHQNTQEKDISQGAEQTIKKIPTTPKAVSSTATKVIQQIAPAPTKPHTKTKGRKALKISWTDEIDAFIVKTFEEHHGNWAQVTRATQALYGAPYTRDRIIKRWKTLPIEFTKD